MKLAKPSNSTARAKHDGTLSAERARQLFLYSPDTGTLTWRVNRSGNAIRGTQAGSLSGGGYRAVRFDGRTYKVHRLAWLIVTGCWPNGQIDHIDCNPSNNRWENLREATHQQNTANAKIRRDNSSGFKGVKPLKGKFQARLGNGGCVHIGTFDTAEEASRAYQEAAKIHYGKFARAQ